MSERPLPYVGVSGVVGREQQYELERIAERAELLSEPSRRQLLLGVKAVHKTQYLDQPNKYGEDWYPVRETRFAEAIEPRGHVDTTFPVAQVYFEPEQSTYWKYRQRFTDRIMARGGSWIKGMQYDMLPWHRYDFRDYLHDVRDIYGKRTLLQAHGPAMEALGPGGTAKVLGSYGPVLDYVLFDSSHGRGQTLDTVELRRYLDEAYSTSELAHVGFAVAGGLDGDVVHNELRPLVRDFPDLSWDAEGKLHPVTGEGRRPLDIPTAERYIEISSRAIRDSR
jgi:hypothetical protein